MAFTNKVVRNPITGQDIRFVRTAADTGGKLLEMETIYRPHSAEPTDHYHPYQAEEFTVLQGELTVRIDGQLEKLKPGDTLHIPANTVHAMWNASDQKTVVTWQVRPALDTEYLLETASGLAADGKVTASGMPPLLQTALLVNRFSGVFRVAKPSFVVQKILFTILAPVAYLFGYKSTYGKYLD
ncbi:cupin domain-containing protein [Spirosoma sp. SC4-14]|uniref:cupin domain-containing protein n=1 Tax=Spirosoma sp. SC4-14 TaxID=3128900 RepID=UPI0030D3320D